MYELLRSLEDTTNVGISCHVYHVLARPINSTKSERAASKRYESSLDSKVL